LSHLESNPPLPEPPTEHELPHSFESEQSVLGAVLLEAKAMDEIDLKGSEFYAPAHRKIFDCMLELGEDGEPIDVTTLTARLQEKGWMDQVGGFGYLAKLAGFVPTAANVGHYVNIMKERHLQRQLILELEDRLAEARSTDDPGKLVAKTQADLDALADTGARKKEFRWIYDILPECFEDVEKAYNHKGEVTGITSGYPDLDKMTSGFQNSDLIIVAARPSVGKTAFALNVARNAAQSKIVDQTIQDGETVAVFSLEMSEKQLVNRMICAEANVDASRMRTGHLQGDDWEKLSMAIGSLSEAQIHIDDTPAITVSEIRRKCRKLQKEKGLGLIIVDYLQLIEGRRKGENRTQEVSEISRSLKALAKEMDVPVIALSQLSRSVEQRQDKRPMLSDLRESGAIEQDADIVAFLYRDDYYDKETEKKNIIEIIISKQRNGPTGTVELVFLKNFNKFVTLDRGHVEAMSNVTPLPTKPRPSNTAGRHWA
jgi:replicative DNA helicase